MNKISQWCWFEGIREAERTRFA